MEIHLASIRLYALKKDIIDKIEISERDLLVQILK